MAPGLTTPLVPVSQAREELGKFFQLAAMAQHAPGMFSAFIDAEWHRMIETDGYKEFCQATAGANIKHDVSPGEGQVTWLSDYHQRFGPLPAAWFADEHGVVDTKAHDEYRSTQTVYASWNCSADTGGDSE